MWLKRISILNYKNLEQVELAFSHKMNCIIGKTEWERPICWMLFITCRFAKVRPMLLIRRTFCMIVTFCDTRIL